MLHQSQLILIERREAEEDVGFKRFTFLPLYIFDGLKYVVIMTAKLCSIKQLQKRYFVSFIFTVSNNIVGTIKVQEIVVFGPILFYFEL